ncbi:MAG: DUF393 domain-containing protein [Verrucomicrobiaceae bacterium]|nr:DUF393 domain-containing protein [Verrucomicrobiaceae bacterium]
MQTLTVFYDARCGLCSRFRRWMQAQPSYVTLEFVPYDSALAKERCPQIGNLRADEEIVVMSDEGSLWQGAAAWVTCLWALCEYREWSARLAHPTMQAMARRVVHWVSGNRIRLSGLMRLTPDEIRKEAHVGSCADGACRVDADG